jgi:hypothetical protein
MRSWAVVRLNHGCHSWLNEAVAVASWVEATESIVVSGGSCQLVMLISLLLKTKIFCLWHERSGQFLKMITFFIQL